MPSPKDDHHRHLSCRTSIEIIPGDWNDWASPTIARDTGPSASFPFLLVDGNLGVPHRVAYRLYLTASSFPRFKEFTIMDEKGMASVVQKTAIVLLINPAHQTALNIRKHLIGQGRCPVDNELRLIDLLVRGVKVCAKESALWAHRRWCLHFLYGPVSNHTSNTSTLAAPFPTLAQTPLTPFLPPEAASREFSVVRQAVTLYPRSYHAWSHWRYSFDICCALVSSSSASNELRHAYSQVILGEFKELNKWIGTHTSDTSAVHHLVTSLPTIWSLTSSNTFSADVCQSLREESASSKLAGEAWHLLSTFLPYRETGWIYLEFLLGYLTTEERAMYLERMLSLHVPWDKRRKRFGLVYHVCAE